MSDNTSKISKTKYPFRDTQEISAIIKSAENILESRHSIIGRSYAKIYPEDEVTKLFSLQRSSSMVSVKNDTILLDLDRSFLERTYSCTQHDTSSTLHDSKDKVERLSSSLENDISQEK